MAVNYRRAVASVRDTSAKLAITLFFFILAVLSIYSEFVIATVVFGLVSVGLAYISYRGIRREMIRRRFADQ